MSQTTSVFPGSGRINVDFLILTNRETVKRSVVKLKEAPAVVDCMSMLAQVKKMRPASSKQKVTKPLSRMTLLRTLRPRLTVELSPNTVKQALCFYTFHNLSRL